MKNKMNSHQKLGSALMALQMVLWGCSAKDAAIQVSGPDPYAHPALQQSSRMADPSGNSGAGGAPVNEGDDVDDDEIPSEARCGEDDHKVRVCHHGHVELCIDRHALRGHRLELKDHRNANHHGCNQSKHHHHEGDTFGPCGSGGGPVGGSNGGPVGGSNGGVPSPTPAPSPSPNPSPTPGGSGGVVGSG